MYTHLSLSERKMPLAAIKQQLDSRIELSKKLLGFIEQVVSNKVSKEEVEAVCVDLFGQKVARPSKALVIYSTSIKNTISTYEKLSKICAGKNRDLMLGTIDLSLEDEILTNKLIVQNFDDGKSHENARLTRVMCDETEFLNSLRERLKPHLPAYYQFFKKYFHFQLINSDYRKFENHKVQQRNYQLNIAFDEKKCDALSRKLALNSTAQTMDKIIGFFIQKPLDENLKKMAFELGNITVDTIATINRNAKEIKRIVNQDNSMSDLVRNALGFYELLCKLRLRMTTFFKEMDKLQEQEIVQLDFKTCVAQVEAKFKKLSNEFDGKKQDWADICNDCEKSEDPDLTLILKKISISEKIITLYLTDLIKIIEEISVQENKLTAEKINTFKSASKNKVNDIKKIIFQYNEAQLEYQTLANTLSRQKLLQEMLRVQKEKQVFIEEKQTHLLLWKAKIEEAKKAKAATAINPLCTSVKPVTQLENPSHEALLKIAESLKHLSTRKIALLKAIFNGEKGITYHQVYYFLTNKLGAKIVEHGGGSSHKTIIMNNYATCLMTNSQLPPIIKSGALKPHEGVHQSGELSGFNLDLIEIALIKAGITLEVVELLEEQKLKDRLNKIKI